VRAAPFCRELPVEIVYCVLDVYLCGASFAEFVRVGRVSRACRAWRAGAVGKWVQRWAELGRRGGFQGTSEELSLIRGHTEGR
jgi:hypothetical protein